MQTKRSDLRTEELGDSECLELLIESIQDYAVFMLDSDGYVVTWSSGAQRIKQYAADEILGKHFSVFYPAEDVQAGKCERELAVAAATGRFEEESWRVRKDGSRFWASVIISAIRNDARKLIGFAKVTRDLTERKRAEDERMRLARAEEGVALRDEFLAIASHELKTPLTSLALQLSGIARSLSKGVMTDAALEKLVGRVRVAGGSLEHVTSLVDRLLDVSRIASGRLQLNREQVRLGDVVREVVARTEHDLTRAECPLTVDVDDRLVGHWDRLRLDQVLVNFISNAIKYGAGKPIEIKACARGGRAALAVRDHGIGVAEDDQKRIFERFARAVPAAHYGGLGLGLWIVRLIVEALGGSVSVESRLGDGATFTATLPLEQAPSA